MTGVFSRSREEAEKHTHRGRECDARDRSWEDTVASQEMSGLMATARS